MEGYPEDVNQIYGYAPDGFSKLEKRIFYTVKRLRLNIVLHSCIYYRRNDSIISDHQFDLLCKRLWEVQKRADPAILVICPFPDDFLDWDGTTTQCHGLKAMDSEWAMRKSFELMEISRKFSNFSPQN